MSKLWNKVQAIIKPKRPGKKEAQIVIYAGAGLVMGILLTAVLYHTPHKSVSNSWQTELDMYYDPMLLIQGTGNIALIDIRSESDFNKGHIDSAVNIPFEDNDTFLASIQGLQAQRVVLYGENTYSLIPLRAAQLLAQSDITVQVLRVGWNEFAFFPSFWLSQDQVAMINIVDYLALPEASSP